MNNPNAKLVARQNDFTTVSLTRSLTPYRSFLTPFALLGLLVSGVSGCKLPGDYRGTFANQGAGLSLKVQGNKATLTLPDGRKLQAKASELSVDSLATGKPGIYISDVKENPNEMEVFWVNPKGRPNEEHDLIWMEAEVIVTRMTKKQKGKARELTLMHCEEGALIVDRVTRTTNGGCPAGTESHTLVRTK
jgi:hypothetical protein